MPITVLVTGGTGFISGWTIVELLKRGYTVRTTIRSLGKASWVRTQISTQVDPGDRLSFAVADLTNDDGWDTARRGLRLCASCRRPGWRRCAARPQRPDHPNA